MDIYYTRDETTNLRSYIHSIKKPYRVFICHLIISYPCRRRLQRSEVNAKRRRQQQQQQKQTRESSTHGLAWPRQDRIRLLLETVRPTVRLPMCDASGREYTCRRASRCPTLYAARQSGGALRALVGRPLHARTLTRVCTHAAGFVIRSTYRMPIWFASSYSVRLDTVYITIGPRGR